MKAPKKNNQPDIHFGEQLPVHQNPFRCLKQIRKILAVINALLRLRVKLANGDASISVTGEGGVLIDLTKLAATGTGSGSLIPRGEWTTTPATPYMTFDLVTVRGTVNAGTWYSLADNNTTQPWNSISWFQISNNAGAMGTW